MVIGKSPAVLAQAVVFGVADRLCRQVRAR